MKNIVLIGFMGTGKSTIGRELSRRTSWKFLDMDQLIEKEQGRTIPEIFAAVQSIFPRRPVSCHDLQVMF